MTEPIVVNMSTCDPPWGQPGDVKIDRTTKWGNPFPITVFQRRSESLLKYALYLKSATDSGRLDVSELLSAKRLGCHCHPLACHGDILKRAIRDRVASEQKTLGV